MFTGIIEETGIVQSLRIAAAGAALCVEAQRISPELKIGDSVAVNGVCLTVVDIDDRSFSCELSTETLSRTTLGRARPGTIVNLERPLAVGDRMGGHIVQGHVDGVGKLAASIPTGDGVEMEFSLPEGFDRYLVTKGSVAVDGISLTIAQLKADAFTVAIIPLTYRVTNLRHLRSGNEVNLEADVLAKYFERFFEMGSGQRPDKKPKLTTDWLREQGF